MNKKQEPRLRFKGFTGAWEDRILGKVSDVRDGTHDSPIYQNQGIPLVTSKNLTENGLDFSNVSLISQEDYEEINKRSKVESGDILLGLIGTIGKPVLVKAGGYAIKNVGLIKELLEVKNEFLLPLLQSNIFETYVSRKNTGNTQKFLALDGLRSFEFLAPPLPEQTHLGLFFRCLDSQIAESRAVLEKSRQLKKAMLEKMFPANGEKMPKIRFKGFEGEWEEKNFESVGEFNPKTEIPSIFQYVDLESVVGTQLISYREESKETAPSRAQRLAKNGDLFFQAVRPYQKNNYLFEKNNENFVFSTGYIQIRPQNDGYFLLTLVQKEEFVQEVLLRCTGTSYPAINASSLQDIAILTPQTSKEQIAIGNFFRQLDETIALQSAEVEKLNQLKKGLLAAMLV
ncbi:restriction endonuclease subunit S [Neisseria subflava]|uniref:restriction endonuclease subunit S n=1 Tax=Neisseria subflava TaxID=28449 RepID=UPI000D32238C|nr:restriction endonuclease subunit S [Neisseria subflava]